MCSVWACLSTSVYRSIQSSILMSEWTWRDLWLMVFHYVTGDPCRLMMLHSSCYLDRFVCLRKKPKLLICLQSSLSTIIAQIAVRVVLCSSFGSCSPTKTFLFIFIFMDTLDPAKSSLPWKGRSCNKWNDLGITRFLLVLFVCFFCCLLLSAE